MNSTNTASSGSHPLLIFKHNSKAAGGSTLGILNQIKPIKFSRKARLCNSTHYILDAKVQTKNSTYDKKYPEGSSIEVNELGEDVHKTFIHVYETQLLYPYDKSNGFVISNIR